jgi:predicted ArsR family transcriptional regulator
MTSTRQVERTPATPAGSLVPLLGEQRAAIVLELRRVGDASTAELAAHLGISEVATRRHLAVLQEEELVAAEVVAQGRGRPAARYRLTDTAQLLFPHRYDRFATEVLDFLADAHGRDGLRAFLRWRLEREVAGLADAVTAEDLHARLDQLADALSERGFAASVQAGSDGFTLVQDHCAIGEVAREHPEICAYEAATFAEVLGRDVTLSRRETLASGARACVCKVASRTSEPAAPNPHDEATEAPATPPGEPT